MVRANRPWRLITGLSGSLAAALAAGAFAVVPSDIWQLADSLSPLRLSVATVFSVGAMVAWLIIDHELWERPSGRVARDRARPYNAATVLTVDLGVGCLYVALLVGHSGRRMVPGPPATCSARTSSTRSAGPTM